MSVPSVQPNYAPIKKGIIIEQKKQIKISEDAMWFFCFFFSEDEIMWQCQSYSV